MMKLIRYILIFFFICTGALTASATKSYQKVVPYAKQLDKKVDKKGGNKKALEKTYYPSKQNLSVQLFGIVTAGIFILIIILFGFHYNSKRGGSTTFAIIKPDAFDKAEEIIKEIKDKGFEINKQAKFSFSDDLAKEFYKEHNGRKFFNDLIQYMTSEKVVVLKLFLPESSCAVKEFKDLAGPTDPENAKFEKPNTLRAKYGTNIEVNAIHAADTEENAEREINLIFDWIKSNPSKLI
ncbi:MAG: nucleoside-diphosphate kinase [Bacteroidota bacterium]